MWRRDVMTSARLRMGVAALSLGVVAQAAAADRTLVETTTSGVTTSVVPADAHVTVGVGAAGGVPTTVQRVVASGGAERVLIRLRGEPLAKARARGLAV